MLPTGFKTTLLRVHAKAWTAVYRFAQMTKVAKYMDEGFMLFDRK